MAIYGIYNGKDLTEPPKLNCDIVLEPFEEKPKLPLLPGLNGVIRGKVNESTRNIYIVFGEKLYLEYDGQGDWRNYIGSVSSFEN